MLEIDRNGSFKNRPGPFELAYLRLPLGILQPCSHMVLLHSKRVLETLSHTVLIVLELFGICYTDLSGAMVIKLVLDALPNKLL